MFIFQYVMLALSFIYNLMIIIVFFSKSRIKNFETSIYSYLIIANVIGGILETFCVVFGQIFPSGGAMPTLYVRLYMIYILFWIFTFTTYVVYISFFSNPKKALSNKALIKIQIAILTVFSILVLLIIKLPLKLYSDGKVSYTEGTSSDFLSMLHMLAVIISLISIIINFKKIELKKKIPVLILILATFLIVIVKSISPGTQIIGATFVFITTLMYFTIENPDLKMMNELEIAKKNAEKANYAKTEFLSNMSHEIRTPLNAIVGFSNSIMEDKSIEEAKEEAKDIIMASQNLLEIVNGILDISKIEAGKMEIVNVNYNPLNLFNDISKLIKPRIAEKPIEFKTSFAKDIPGVLYGDNGKVKEIITNLLTNAAKYTDKGEIEFKVSCINEKNISKLVISVEDTGRGIKPEKIDKLFTKFNRLEEDKNTTLEGTGLGLAITKNLVDMMGGKIVVQSKYGEGSKFTVYLSQKIISMVDDTVEEKTTEEEVVDYSNKKILIVDDNNLNLKVAARILKKYRIDPDMSISGFECIERLKDNKYDLILMDDMMPKLSGVDTFKKLKEDKDFDTPVVVLTANAISGMREKYLKQGFNDYLAKPIESTELDRILKKFLNNKKK